MQLPAVAAIVLGLAEELEVPVRGMGGAPRFIGSFYGMGKITPAALVAVMDEMEAGETAEIMCHPAYLDPEILSGSRYAVERVHELTTLIDPAVRLAAEARGIQLISYRSL